MNKDKPIPESEDPIAQSVMEEILKLDDEAQAVLLGKDPDARPDMKGFEKVLAIELKAAGKHISTEDFLYTCNDSDVSFRQGWLVLQRLISKQ